MASHEVYNGYGSWDGPSRSALAEVLVALVRDQPRPSPLADLFCGLFGLVDQLPESEPTNMWWYHFGGVQFPVPTKVNLFGRVSAHVYHWFLEV